MSLVCDGRPPLANPTIKPRWYRRGEGLLSGFNIPLLRVSQCSASTGLCYVSPTVWTSIGRNYAQRKYAWPGLELETSWLRYHARRLPLANSTIKPRWYGRGWGLLMLWSSIPPPACESRPRARAMGILSEQQSRWELLHAAEEKGFVVGLASVVPPSWYPSQVVSSSSPGHAFRCA
jgi:hypothetical protein